MKKLVFLCFAIIFNHTLIAQHKNVTQKKSIESHLILKRLLSEPGINNKEMQMEIVDFPPLSVSAPHRHPCPTFGFVLEGRIESIFEGESFMYKKGDSFFETTNGLHTKTRNPDGTKPAKLLVFYIMDPDKPTSVPEH
jgi:quercetin dioxygenase-like cupin family protein